MSSSSSSASATTTATAPAPQYITTDDKDPEVKEALRRALRRNSPAAVLAALKRFKAKQNTTAVFGLTVVAKLVLQAAKLCAHKCMDAVLRLLRTALRQCGSRNVERDVAHLLCAALHHVAALSTPCSSYNGGFAASRLAAHSDRVHAMVTYLTRRRVDPDALKTRSHRVCYGEGYKMGGLLPEAAAGTDSDPDTDDGSDMDSDDQSDGDESEAETAARLVRCDRPYCVREYHRFQRLFFQGSRDPCTPLSTAIRAGNLFAVKALLCRGAGVNFRLGTSKRLPVEEALAMVQHSTAATVSNAKAIVAELLSAGATTPSLRLAEPKTACPSFTVSSSSL